jgi:ferredoxin-thioredoxin reductase catalytic chain
MSSEARKESLKYLYERVVTPLGFKFTPDQQMVDDLLEAEVKLEQDLGAPFCPCQGRSGVRVDAMKRCWCGLFVHLDVTDPDSLPQFPPDEV